MSNDYSSQSNLGGTVPSLWAFLICTENGFTKEFHETLLSICLGLVLCWAPVHGTAEPVPLQGDGEGKRGDRDHITQSTLIVFVRHSGPRTTKRMMLGSGREYDGSWTARKQGQTYHRRLLRGGDVQGAICIKRRNHSGEWARVMSQVT